MSVRFDSIIAKCSVGLSGIALLVVAAFISTPALAVTSQVPLYLTTSAAPLMMLAMSRDEQLFKKAYPDYTDLNGDGLLDTTYNDAFDYSGYFDGSLCYSYSTTDSRFKAEVAATDINGNGKAHECGSAVTPSGARWSGNFLNWVAMSRIDVLRFVLYGGYRSSDSATQTILERAHIPNDLHAWSKVYSGSDTANYTPFTGTQSFCNATFDSSGNYSATGEPRIRRAPNNWSEWAATSVNQCRWANTTDAPSQPSSDYEFVARVEVCQPSGAIRESFCKQYGASSYKPTGLLQRYGEPQPGSTVPRMRFGLLSGSFGNPRSGGVLRRNIGSLANNAGSATPSGCSAGDEIDLSNGVFCNQGSGDESIINAVNRLKLVRVDGTANWSGSNWNDCNTYGIHNRDGGNGELNNPGSGSSSNRRCNAWGNPISEIYAEALRYLAGEAKTTGFSSNTDLSGLPVPNWLDPYRSEATGGNPYCATCSLLVLSSGLASFDSDEIPGSAVLENSAAVATKAVGDLESISGGQYLIGRVVADQTTLAVGNNVNTHEDLCVPSIITDLGLARGLCPDIPSQEGSYLMAGLAYQARTQDMRPSLAKPADKKVSVNTYSVALAENLPKFDIPVSGSKITFSPLCQANNTGGAAPAASGWRSCYLGSVSIGSKTASISPNYVYGRPLEADGSAGSFSLVWEDSQWGNDHDNDVVTMITYCVGSQCQVISGTRNGTGTSYTASYSGYDICWRSNSTVCGTNGTPTVAADEVLIRVENLSAYAGNSLLAGYTITGSNNDGVKRTEADGAAWRPSSDASVLTSQANPPSSWSRPQVIKYKAGASDSNLLENPLWYASKFGGFVTLDDEKAENPVDQGTDSWDKDNDGTPDTYFKVTDPAELKTSLEQVFTNVLERSSSAAAIATNSTRLDTNTLIFQAKFNSADWSGTIDALRVSATTGAVGAVEWSTDDAGTFPASSSSRKIFTWDDEPVAPADKVGIDFEWADLNGTQQTFLNDGDGQGEDRVLWLRGNPNKEVGVPGGVFRKRSKLLGDIVNSDPAFVGTTNFGYENLPLGDPGQDSYVSYRTSTSARPKMLYVGANDGMLHAFDAETGVEQFAYVPNHLFPELPKLTDPDYEHQYYVDGAPNIGDAYIDDGEGVGDRWRTVLIGTTGAGGSAVFALDVTDPESFDEQDVLWEIDANDAGFANLGQTIGYATIGRLTTGQWVAVFGNGYSSANGLASLFIVDVETGALVAEVIACAEDDGSSCVGSGNGLSTPALLVNSEREIIAAYAGDLRGNLWKFDLDGAFEVDYKSGPDFVPLFVAGTSQPITAPLEIGVHPSGGYMIYFGTGKYYEVGDAAVGNNPPIQSFYGIWDNGSRITNGRSDLQEQEIIGELSRTVVDQQGTSDTSDDVSTTYPLRGVSDNVVDWTTDEGWYLDLVSPVNGAEGERVVSAPRLRNGRVIFPTVIPSTASCDPGGTSWLMELDALSGGRLDEAVFDLDGNRIFNTADYITVDGVQIPASGMQSSQGIIKTPAIVSAGEVEYKYAGGSAGGIQKIVEKGGDRAGRQSWRQLR